MRGHALSSHSGFPSDTNLLVDACIARVRETARLDDDAVLPPLPRMTPRRGVVIFAKDRTPASAAGPSLARGDVTQRVSRPSDRDSRGRSRWAVALCALVAGAFGTASFLASPVGHAPSVLHATAAARGQLARLASAADATAALFTR